MMRVVVAATARIFRHGRAVSITGLGLDHLVRLMAAAGVGPMSAMSVVVMGVRFGSLVVDRGIAEGRREIQEGTLRLLLSQTLAMTMVVAAAAGFALPRRRAAFLCLQRRLEPQFAHPVLDRLDRGRAVVQGEA